MSASHCDASARDNLKPPVTAQEPIEHVPMGTNWVCACRFVVRFADEGEKRESNHIRGVGYIDSAGWFHTKADDCENWYSYPRERVEWIEWT